MALYRAMEVHVMSLARLSGPDEGKDLIDYTLPRLDGVIDDIHDVVERLSDDQFPRANTPAQIAQ
jgi:hypothetical protein